MHHPPISCLYFENRARGITQIATAVSQSKVRRRGEEGEGEKGRRGGCMVCVAACCYVA